jgi:uncharacterized protein YuzE
MRLEYDPDSKAAYIQLRDCPIAGTDEIAPGVFMDVDEQGRPVGFDILNAVEIFGGVPRSVEFVLLHGIPRRKAG